jgi:hypothetical protein
MLLFSFILFFYSVNTTILGQDISIAIEIEIDENSAINNGIIILSVEKGIEPFTFFLYEGQPWNNGVLIEKSDESYDNQYIFENLKPGEYYVGVVDSENKSHFKISVIPDNKTTP